MAKIADTEGTIVEVACGPGSGHASVVLLQDPDRRILVNDVSVKMVQLQREQAIKEKVGANVLFVAFDATQHVLRPETVHVISDRVGYTNTRDPEAGFRAGFDALVPGGRMFSMSPVFDLAAYDSAPESCMEKWSHILRGTWCDLLEQIGFQIDSCENSEPYSVPPEDGTLATDSLEIGIAMRRMTEFIEATKPPA